MTNRHKRSPSYWRRQLAEGRIAADDPRVRLTPRAPKASPRAREEDPAPTPPGTGPSSLDARISTALAATPRAGTRHR